ncbi:hypothetical protein PO170_23300 [Bacteroides ovatus]|uniref:hypothetical protein n=1 Tax=Bacteroidaceae TaxID=815 RepID=UPI00129CCDC4|nr:MULTISPECIES: hypothetical protein [Bacteroidaceae]MDC2426812.1 hypothetical protein [Bacteroides ovatus]MDC2431996.1 hypothetical protein [Bacteroides ovatus]MDC2446900.1 hypothetical protein [Bacteroides ovatus]MDC2539318.1 hypothetical protein [Bacteroides ovatus]MDC2549400.1 hypothetical protein [Bacteroides ovatus]
MSGLWKPLAAPSVNAIFANRSPNNVKLPVSLPLSSVVVPHSHRIARSENLNENEAIPDGYMKLYVSLSIKSMTL